MGLSDRKQTTAQTQSSTSQGSTANQYGFQNVPDTPDIIAARNDRAQADPSIGFRAAEKERQLNESFDNPMGGFVTPQIRDAIRRSGQRELFQQAGQQAREGQFDVNRLNQSKNLALAGLTRPILTQTGSTSTGSSTGTGSSTVRQSESPWGTIAQVGAQAAPLSL